MSVYVVTYEATVSVQVEAESEDVIDVMET